MSDLLYSAEVRWFFNGRLPAPFLAWFAAGKALEPVERTDSYLLLPGCESIGVKQREGRFEIKAIRGASESIALADGINGRSDSWVKWSYGGEGIDNWIAALNAEPDGWLEVTKKRWLRKFSLDNGRLEEVDPMDNPLEGCGFEVTMVNARGSDWWTFGLEGFGGAENVRDNLRRATVGFFKANKPPMPLSTVSSCSYPVWLNSFL